MANSAKVTFRTHDNSGFIPAYPGVAAAMVHSANKGKCWTPVTTRSETDFNKKRGLPDPKLGIFHYIAYGYHTQSDTLHSVRVTHRNPNRANGDYTGEAKFSTILLRGKTLPVDLNDPEAVFSQESVIGLPYKAMVQEEIDAFIFDQYHTNREYSKIDGYIKRKIISYVDGNPVVKELVLSNIDGIEEDSFLSFTVNPEVPNDSSAIFKVVSAGVESHTYHAITLDKPYVLSTGDAREGVAVKYKDVNGNIQTYSGNPRIEVDALDGSVQILVTDSDKIGEGDIILFGNSSDEYTVTDKDLVSFDEKRVKFESAINVSLTNDVYLMTQSELEERDALLVCAESEGDFGNTVSIGIEVSKNYSYAFDLIVYVNGVETERFTDCTRYDRIDGLGNQMNVEDKVNGKSEWILVKSNLSYNSELNPKTTSVSYFRPLPVDIFVQNTADEVNGAPMWTTTEKVLSGDTFVRISSQTGLEIGDRIRFGTYLDEYKILSISNVDGKLTIELDREFVPTSLSLGSSVRKYVRSETQKIQEISKGLYGYKKDNSYTIGGTYGVLLDAGINFMKGGDNGDAITVYDLILGLEALKNKESIKFSLLLDGGFAHPAYAQALTQLAEKRGDCHVYLSTPLSAEESADYIKAIKDYRNSLNINSSVSSLFAGWVKVADPYTQKNVWVSPVGFAAAAQSYTAKTFAMWYPAAGWKRGKLMALDIKRRFEESERDDLVGAQINPIRYKEGSGLVIWGNETLLVEPSVRQMRHVAFLEIVIKVGLEVYLEGKLFDLATEQGRLAVEAEAQAYMRDEIGDGVLDSLVSVVEYTDANDLANRRVKMFLGIKPTPDINNFIVDLTLFNASQQIKVI